MNRFIASLSLAAVALGAPAAHAAQRLGNGTDRHAFADAAAWFEHESKVRYCIDVDAAFGRTADQLAGEIEAARSVWTTYLERLRTPIMTYALPPFERMARCDGSQDLRFAFGVEDREVQDAAKDLRLNAPTAFAYLLSHDIDQHIGKGLIWIAPSGDAAAPYPQWQVPNTLRAILVHELGHTLGSDHIEGTIMRSDLETFLRDEMLHPGTYGDNLWQIDGEQELVPCLACRISYGGSVPGDAFALLMGREPVLPVSATLATGGSTDPSFVATRWLLTVTDARGTAQFPFTVEADLAAMPLNFVRGPVAIRASDREAPIDDNTPGRLGLSLDNFATYMATQLTTPAGRTLPAIFSRNMGSVVGLSAIVGGREQQLFSPSTVLHSDINR